MYDGVETVIHSISAWLKPDFFFLCQSYFEILAVIWARLAFPPIQEAICLKAVRHCVVNSSKCPGITCRILTRPCPQDFHSLYLTCFDPAALSNEYESNSLYPLTHPQLFVLFFFSLRQTVAGRMLRPPHQWLHPQKDPEAFTLTPPTDPPPAHPSILFFLTSSITALPAISPKTNAEPHRGQDMTCCV